MPQDLEKLFQEEVRSRQQSKQGKAFRQPRKKYRAATRKLVLIVCCMFGFSYLLYLFSLSPSGQPRYSDVDTAIDAQRRANLKPVPLPPSGVQKAVSLPADSVGVLRFFLREPRPEDNSSLKNCDATETTTGQGKHKYHHYVEVIDWESNEVVTTAFIRSGDMVELYPSTLTNFDMLLERNGTAPKSYSAQGICMK